MLHMKHCCIKKCRLHHVDDSSAVYPHSTVYGVDCGDDVGIVGISFGTLIGKTTDRVLPMLRMNHVAIMTHLFTTGRQPENKDNNIGTICSAR